MRRCDCPTEIDDARIYAHLATCGNPQWALLVTMGMETGLRTTELTRLLVRDCWRNNAPVSVIHRPRRMLKGGAGIRARSTMSRTIPVNERLQLALVAAMSARPNARPDEPLFPGPSGTKSITRRQVARIVRTVFVRAGLDPNRSWAGQSLRRRLGRRTYESTLDLETTRLALGHRWASTTQGYLGYESDRANEAILALGRLSPAAIADMSMPKFAVG